MYLPESLMTKLGISMEDFQERIEFIGLTENDLKLLSGMGSMVFNHINRIVTIVRQRFLSLNRTQHSFKSESDCRLIFKEEDLLEIFQGYFDEAYVEKRLRTGAILHKSGLAPKWYISANSIYENLLSGLIFKALEDKPDEALNRILAIQKIFFLNTTLTLDFYRHCLTTQLEEKIRDLDEFTHVVSHDLKEPLRGMEAFSTFLIQDYSQLIDEKGKQYLNFLKESAVHMKELVNDLLTVSAIARQEPKFQWINLNDILAQVLHDLKFSIQQKKAEIQINSLLPTLFCDPIQIGQVFQNLISNAIKFNKSTPPQVEIETKDEGAFFLFTVRDNGIGIDPRYGEQIFQLFERLHQKEEFDGTGAGLSISKRIIERFGGSIKVDSQPGRGSEFYFSLPKSRFIKPS